MWFLKWSKFNQNQNHSTDKSRTAIPTVIKIAHVILALLHMDRHNKINMCTHTHTHPEAYITV